MTVMIDVKLVDIVTIGPTIAGPSNATFGHFAMILIDTIRDGCPDQESVEKNLIYLVNKMDQEYL